MNKSNRPAAPHPEKIGPNGIHGIHTKIVKTIATLIGTLCVSAPALLAADPSSVVHIPDPVLLAAIRATLGKPVGEITTADMESLTTLDASRSTRGCVPSIESLEGLQTAINLTSLDFRGDWDRFMPPFEEACPTPAVLGTSDFSTLSQLGNLQSLSLSGNGLVSLTLPLGLTNLHTLELIQNSFDDLALPADMTNLHTLSVQGVTNVVFLEGLMHLRRLTWLPHWDSLPEIVLPPGLKSLEQLVLGAYGLTNLVLPPDSTNLHSLHLHGEFKDASFLNGLLSLRTLRLDYSTITTLPTGLTNLVELSLNGNPLTNVSFLNELQKLTELSLSGCALSNAVDLQFLNSLSQLRKLELGYNEFTSFPLPPESGLTNLVELNLAGNPLVDVSLSNLKQLTNLSLSTCALANQADIRFLNALTLLQKLDLSENRLTNFVLTNAFSQLEELNLRGNALTNVNLAPVQSSLKRLNLSYNPLTELPFLENFSQLEVLDFYTRDLTRFTLPWGLTSLRILGLRGGLLLPSEITALGSQRAMRKVTVVSPNFTYVGIPASTDLTQLTLHGHWKNAVTVLGLWMRPPFLRADGQIGLRISGAAGRTVQVQTTSDTKNWDNWQTLVLGQNGAELSDDTSSSTPRFFRVVGAEGR